MLPSYYRRLHGFLFRNREGINAMIKFIRKTTAGCPAQWEGETIPGEKIYLRYRHNNLTINIGEDFKREIVNPKGLPDNNWDGYMTTEELIPHLMMAIIDNAQEKEQL